MQSYVDFERIYRQSKAFGVSFDTQVRVDQHIIKDELLFVRDYQLN